MFKKPLFLLAIGLLVLVTVTGGIMTRNLQAQESPSGIESTTVALGTGFNYLGQVADAAGNPIDGACDLRFGLYDAVVDGAKVGEVTRPNQPVADGLFAVQLDFGTVFSGNARWLEIEVRCPAGDGNYITLSPRQEMSAVPYALSVRPGARIEGSVPGTGFEAGLRVTNSSPDSPIALFGITTATSGPATGVAGGNASPEGIAVSGYSSPAGTGVRGVAFNGVGVWGSSVDTSGVYGESTNGAGIRGRSQTSWGVVGDSISQTGVVGRSQTWIGVYGESASADGTGVQGIANGIGVWGGSVDGTGVYGESTNQTGVRGRSQSSFGVLGDSISQTGVVGRSQTWVGVYGENSNINPAIQARNNGSGPGIFSSSQSGPAAVFDGMTRTNVLEIVGGSDLAERFEVSGGVMAEPGTVMVIDPANPGHLTPATTAYDRKVAGVVSGAGDVATGLVLHQEGVLEGDTIVAIAGRVYVRADATNGAITPGDMLTTSDLPGYVMAATDHDRAQGAVIGKAMTGLESGTGLVLVLINLQ